MGTRVSGWAWLQRAAYALLYLAGPPYPSACVLMHSQRRQPWPACASVGPRFPDGMTRRVLGNSSMLNHSLAWPSMVEHAWACPGQQPAWAGTHCRGRLGTGSRSMRQKPAAFTQHGRMHACIDRAGWRLHPSAMAWAESMAGQWLQWTASCTHPRRCPLLATFLCGCVR